MHAELSDYHIANLIVVARYLLKLRVDWLDKYGDMDMNDPHVPPHPDSYGPYLKIASTIRDAMKWRLQHRKNIAHVWKVYADSVLKNRTNGQQEKYTCLT